MAVFDQQNERIFLRVVYDGPAFAGKTTNLKQLCSFITLERRGELYVPEESDGRTLYFDWLELAGGAIGRVPLISQLLTVPGQVALRRRRRHLLRSADAVAFVCDSTPAGVEEARAMLSLLMPMRRRDGVRDVPLVVQANKQDLAAAHTVDRVRELLQLDEDVVLVEAEAHKGLGVRETAVLAIRAAVAQVRDKIVREGAAPLGSTPQDADHLYREMLLADTTRPSILESLVSPTSEEIDGFFSNLPRVRTPEDWP